MPVSGCSALHEANPNKKKVLGKIVRKKQEMLYINLYIVLQLNPHDFFPANGKVQH